MFASESAPIAVDEMIQFSSDIRDRLAQYNDDAAARGVFGVPSFFVGTELFFGNDRLDFVRTALRSSAQ